MKHAAFRIFGDFLARITTARGVFQPLKQRFSNIFSHFFSVSGALPACKTAIFRLQYAFTTPLLRSLGTLAVRSLRTLPVRLYYAITTLAGDPRCTLAGDPRCTPLLRLYYARWGPSLYARWGRSLYAFTTPFLRSLGTLAVRSLGTLAGIRLELLAPGS